MIQSMMDSFGIREEAKDRKKSWSELKREVYELRRQLGRLSTPIPTSISFRTLKDGRTRIYFLSTPSNGWENTLFYVDVVNRYSENQPLEKLKWHRIVDTNFLLTAAGKFSREEQLQWERKRLATWGITSYEIHLESGKLVFPAASSLFQCMDTNVYPTELATDTNGAKLNPQICPCNSSLVAFICNNDIWVTHTSLGTTQRLTHVHKGNRSLVDDPISAGIPSYVMQEEFNRFQGFWWQPQSKDNIYRIVYEEVDESEVEISRFPLSKTGETEEFRFPRAGTPNANWNLKMVQFKVNESQICNVVNLELGTPLRTLFHWAEYLVRVGWTPNSQYIWVQLLDRQQKRLELALLAADQFLDVKTISSSEDRSHWTPTVRVLCSQVSEIWINIHDILYFFPCEENSSTISFIWASEETGWRHLYLFTCVMTPHMNGVVGERGDESPHYKKFSGRNIALTSGNWEVLRKHIWIDNARELVYFLGLRESPLEKHLYVVSLTKPEQVRLLTKPGHSYSVDINKECTIMVAVYSNIQTLPSCEVFRIEHMDNTAEGVILEPVGFLSQPPPPSNSSISVFQPELYTHQISSGELLYAMVFKPHSFIHGKKYPTILNIYGGPEVQLVSNTFKGMRQLRMHMLAAQGYCVVAIDSRGSQHRGLVFESYLKGRMGTVELSDQVEVLQWLAESLGFIDMSRVAIHGWSYGGYLSLMALVQYPHIFKIAIAGAPVTCWSLYDTGYTERYMDLPERNVWGYKIGSVLNYVKEFPEEENRLLIIHGLIDENVHFSHTSKFIDAMAKEVKPYELQIYPSERHSLRNLEANQHYETKLLSFLQNNL